MDLRKQPQGIQIEMMCIHVRGHQERILNDVNSGQWSPGEKFKQREFTSVNIRKGFLIDMNSHWRL